MHPALGLLLAAGTHPTLGLLLAAGTRPALGLLLAARLLPALGLLLAVGALPALGQVLAAWMLLELGPLPAARRIVCWGVCLQPGSFCSASHTNISAASSVVSKQARTCRLPRPFLNLLCLVSSSWADLSLLP